MPGEPDIQRVNSAIEAGRPLSEISLFFPTRAVATEYYARLMGARLVRPKTTCCELCGNDRVRFEYICGWQALVPRFRLTIFTFVFATVLVMLSKGHAQTSSAIVFESVHALCRRCAMLLHVRKSLAELLRYLCFTVIILALFASVLGLCFLIGTALTPGGVERGLVWMFLAGLGALALCALGVAASRRLSIPPKLRHVGRHPFELHRIQSVNQR